MKLAWSLLATLLGGMLLPAAATARAPVDPATPVCDTGDPAMYAPLLRWSTGIVYIQPPEYYYHLQLAPHANDGPGIDLVRFKSREEPESYQVQAPPRWYGLLPDMTYTWRVRLSTGTPPGVPDDKGWGAWSEWCRFRTPGASGATIMPVAPAEDASVQGVPTIQWADKDPRIFYYELQVSTDAQFVTDPAGATAPVWWNLVHGGVTSPSNSWRLPSAEPGARYFWRVRPRVQGDGSPARWSSTYSFTVLGEGRVQWRRLTSTGGGPAARRDHSLVADPASGALLLFGGRSGPTERNDLWSYDAGSGRWTVLAPDGPSPPARFGHGAVFDAPGRRMVIYGGQAGSDFLDDTWEYLVEAGTWRRLETPQPPAARYGMGMSLDPAGSRVFVSHGFTDFGRFDDTWYLDLSTGSWRQASGTEEVPEKRCLHRTMWDAGRGRLLLFGGQSHTTPFLGDLWAYRPDGGWLRLHPPGPAPSARFFYSAAQDEAGGRILLFGGRTAQGPTADLWQFDLARDVWQPLAADAGPPAREGHDTAYVPSRRSLLLFGGSAGPDLDDLWEAILP